MLRRYSGFKPKRDHSNSCTPCLTLKPEMGCNDLCCRQFLVVIAQEDLDDSLKTLPPFVDVLAKQANGSCHYFEESTGNCGAWADRPLVCRTYDCRDDVRAHLRLAIKHPVDTVFENSFPERCTQCDRPLRVCAGVSYQTGQQAICIDCGQPYRIHFNYRDRFFRLDPVTWVPPLERRKFLLLCLCYREQWAEAHALLEAWLAEAPHEADLQRQRALVLAELGRLDEARRRLQPLRAAEPAVELDLAWLDTQQGNDAAAKPRIESVLELLTPEERLRANLQLGAIARRANQIEEAARYFQKAIILDRTHPSFNHAIKEYLLEMMTGSPEARARVERGLLNRW